MNVRERPQAIGLERVPQAKRQGRSPRGKAERRDIHGDGIQPREAYENIRMIKKETKDGSV